MLTSLNLKQYYRSDNCNIVEEFYLPCMSQSILYRRAVGFFSSTSLSTAAKGLNELIRNEGKMELIASPLLYEDDINAINKGYSKRFDLEKKSLLNALDEDISKIVCERLGFLAWLIEVNCLDIKIASLNANQYGLYHEKIGLFYDGENTVAFSGSPNETYTGLVSNFETIDVYCSWKDEDRERVLVKESNFIKLWENKTSKLTVYPFPEAVKKKLVRLKPPEVPLKDPESAFSNNSEQGTQVYVDEDNESNFILPVKLRPYQEEARDNWLKANGQGTLKMATGSGKTITALSIAHKLYENNYLEAILIVCPFKHLVNQWSKECEKFGLEPIKCYESVKKWADDLNIKLFNAIYSNKPLCVVTTINTFTSKVFQRNVPHFPKKTILIGDEVHNLGTKNILSILPESITMRLGLSATPERWYDEEGTEMLYQYFGEVLKPEFTLKDALNYGALVPYKYHPIFVKLADDELDQYIEISNKIKRLIHMQTGKEEIDLSNSSLNLLLIQRARLLGSAKNKLVALKELMKVRLETAHTLFYCGDGSVDSEPSNQTARQIEAARRILGDELRYRVDTYTAETPIDEREGLMEQLNSGDLQGLIAIRCLDEGVDLPTIKTAVIMASSSNPRQFIQRRGRILRPADNKKQAEIFDMIIEPPLDEGIDIAIERAIFRRELLRYLEFANLADNAGEVRGKILDIQTKLGLLSI